MNKELALYLKSKQGLNRLFEKLREKYISLGRYNGSVTLKLITEDESIDIGNLLGKRIEQGSTLKTSFQEITKKIEQGKFSGFEWSELFQYYFKDKVVGKKEKKEIEKKEEIAFFELLLDKNKHSSYIGYMRKIVEEQGELYKLLLARYRKNKKELEQTFHSLVKLLDYIPEKPTSLPVFSAVTGNPHFLDFNRSENHLFLRILSFILDVEAPETLEEKITLLSEINVYTDPISNFVITYQLIGNTILEELSEKNQVVNLNLLNINQIEKIDTKGKKVFIFENPSILNTLIGLNVPMIITSGIPNLAFYKVLEKLDKNQNQMYYNGDFDPEGLLIAEKLKLKYPKIELFCYDKLDYEQSQSKEVISESRLKKLVSIKDLGLQDIKELLLQKRMAAYQEKNIDRIEQYIKRTMEN